MKSRLRCEPGAAGCFARRRLVGVYRSIGDRGELDWRWSLLLGEAAIDHCVVDDGAAWAKERDRQYGHHDGS